MTKKVVVVYSGGMDSYTLLNWVYSKGFDVHAISIDYNQRHRKELDYAAQVCSVLNITHHVINMRGLRDVITVSALTSSTPVPEGHYEEESMKQTVVPNRNMILLSVASAYALSIGAGSVYFGAHAGDHAIYPDCRLPFVEAMNDTLQLGNYDQVTVHAPFIDLTKTDIARVGLDLGLDYTNAWTCYNGRHKACGKCGACVERKEAIAISGATDNMEYDNV